jgi:hypothetical protein
MGDLGPCNGTTSMEAHTFGSSVKLPGTRMPEIWESLRYAVVFIAAHREPVTVFRCRLTPETR